MNATEVTKRFWEIMKEFNDSGIDEKVWKDTVIEALGSDSYSILRLEKIYKEGVPERGLGCFFGEDFGMVALGYMLLMRYGLSETKYINWCANQKREFRYLLYRLIGKNMPDLKVAYYTSKLEPLMIYFVNDKRKLFNFSADADGLFTLYGQNLCFHEQIKDIIRYYQFSACLSEDMVAMFEGQYNRMIHKFDDCTDYLMGIVKDVTEVAISRVNEYIKDMEHSQEKVDDIIERYLDAVKGNTPYSFFLDAYAYIAEEYAEDAVKNEIKRIQRESIEFVGGGFGLKGMIAGSAQAAIANKIYRNFLPRIASHSDRRIEYKMNAKKYQLFKDSNFLNEMKNLTADNVNILCEFVLQGLSLGDEVSGYMPRECRNRIDELYTMASSIGRDDLKSVILSVLQVYPFEMKAYKLAYDILRDDENELEILAMLFGVCEFYDYKLEKEPDGLSDDIHRRIRKGARFGFEEIMGSGQKLVPILKHMSRIDHYISEGKQDCIEIKELVGQLLEIMEECGVSQGNKWISCSAQTFYLQKKLYPLLKRISRIACKNEEHEVMFFDYIFLLELWERYGKFRNGQEVGDFTKDEVEEAICFLKRNSASELDDWSSIIKYNEWISKDTVAIVKELQIRLEKLLKSIEEQEEEERRKKIEKRTEENRKRKYIDLTKKRIGQGSGILDLQFSNQFRTRFKLFSQMMIYKKGFVNQYDFELRDNRIRKFFEDRREICGQYILFFYDDFMLTDQNIYLLNGSALNAHKIAIRDVDEILIYKSVISNKYLREIVTKEGALPLDTEKGDKVVDAINLALDPYRKKSYETRYDRRGVRCGRCGSNHIKEGFIRIKCLQCNNSDGETIYELIPSDMVKKGKDAMVRRAYYLDYRIQDDERKQIQWLEEAGLLEESMAMGSSHSTNFEPEPMGDAIAEEEHIHLELEKSIQKKMAAVSAKKISEKREILQEKQKSTIQDDWREKVISTEFSYEFFKRFQAAIKGTDIERFSVNEPIDQLHDRELYMRMSYMREKQPGQFILYSNGRVIITDRFVIWGRVVIAVDEIEEITWKGNPSNDGDEKALLLLKNGQKYLLDKENQQKTIAFALNVALDSSGIIIEELPQEQKAKEVFCVNCGRKIPRSSKFCTFCGTKNNY